MSGNSTRTFVLATNCYNFCSKWPISESIRRAAIGNRDASREIRHLQRVRDITFPFTGKAISEAGVWAFKMPDYLSGNASGGERVAHLRFRLSSPRRAWLCTGQVGNQVEMERRFVQVGLGVQARFSQTYFHGAARCFHRKGGVTTCVVALGRSSRCNLVLGLFVLNKASESFLTIKNVSMSSCQNMVDV